ncbi:MAG: phosphodiester glycosidase family protein [FCB group bacterium]|nr:phosphodiester glycosidase family protein [FCB group bacterium]
MIRTTAKIIVVTAITISCVLYVNACSKEKKYTTINMHWEPMEEVNAKLPDEVRVFYGNNLTIPLRAWYVRVEEVPGEISAHVVVADDADRRETLSGFAQRLNACVVINGGYFLMHKNPTNHVGLIQVDHRIVEPASPSIIRWGKRYFTARGAIGFYDDGSVDIAWVTSRHDSLFEWTEPIPNSPLRPAKELDFSRAKHWPVKDALHAGPVLLTAGEINVTTDEEVFFGSSIPDVHPRTAAGYTADGQLILLVVDGRQTASRGVYLEELAVMMRDLGCVEAINLDGGGSSALVVNGTLLNRPAGSTTQREVMTALAIYCDR